ncbi:MAG: hypothetical protein EBR23_11590, partial [Planctomycetia bacterium]|nr:hypothetical protein [Planctomycetia bacterium]
MPDFVQAAMTAIAALPEPQRAAAEESDSHRSLVSQVQAVFGIAASRQGRWQDAVRHLEAATATSHPDTAWFKPLAFAYAESDEKQRRQKAFDALTRYDPDGIMSELGDDRAEPLAIDRADALHATQSRHLFFDGFADERFDLIIGDEANAWKNVSTRRWKTLHKLVGPDTYLWLMTGTPAAQSPVDAYGLARLVNPTAVP